MDTSDDPVTMTSLMPYATVAAAATGIVAATGGFGGRGGGAKRIGAPEAKTTAEPTVQLSEQAKRNRRLAASALTKDWAEPTLGTPALLGR